MPDWTSGLRGGFGAEPSLQYVLRALVCFGASHYVSFCLDLYTERWCLCDDGRLAEVEPSRLHLTLAFT